MTAFTYRMPAGIPGAITRSEFSLVEGGVLDTTNPPATFGIPMVIDASSHNYRSVIANDLSSAIVAMYVRPYPMQGNGTDGLGTSTPPTSGVCNAMKFGYMSVKLNGATAATKGGAVYARTANPSSGKPVGGLEAAAEVTVAGGTITGTGTGTIAASVTAAALIGTWALTLQSTSQTSKVTVIDPNGLRHPDATVGTAYTSGDLTFTITAAGTMTAGDSFAPVVTTNTILVPNSYFNGPADANGNTELVFNI